VAKAGRCPSTGSSTATTIKSHLLPRGPLLENMLEDREPVVAPEHLLTDKERRHSKRAATESLFRGRGKDSLGFWLLKCRPKQMGSEADLFCQRDTDGLVDRPGIRSVHRCAYPPAVIRGSAKPFGCRSGSGEEPEIEVMTRRLSESDSVVVGPETRIAFSVYQSYCPETGSPSNGSRRRSFRMSPPLTGRQSTVQPVSASSKAI